MGVQQKQIERIKNIRSALRKENKKFLEKNTLRECATVQDKRNPQVYLEGIFHEKNTIV